MSQQVEKIIEQLDNLSSAELIRLLNEISDRLNEQFGSSETSDVEPEEKDTSKQYLPRMPQIIEWGLVKPMEDKVYIKGEEDKPALLLDSKSVAYDGASMSINDWGKHVTGWKGINIYEWTVVERTGRTLDDMRRDYLDEHGE